MSMLAKIEATKAEINLRNLQRHDPTIKKLISSTSYVSVYYNDGAEWIKTGIEGPMFLFSRSQSPLYGFFVLNRQGLEYTREFLTEESDVTVDGEFILYEPRPDAGTSTWHYSLDPLD
ncbi:BQ2448_8110 [Microbotryum intermedium]|uniref:BQ2448_8110 protein n=1 Tax=Microbotryum intermedium TaxID=269621 RepID=A0A238FQJ1_9BASI|nr:BQ2448_8110 [Microbotryum intermedium]